LEFDVLNQAGASRLVVAGSSYVDDALMMPLMAVTIAALLAELWVGMGWPNHATLSK
jgi:hypothetical protein